MAFQRVQGDTAILPVAPHHVLLLRMIHTPCKHSCVPTVQMHVVDVDSARWHFPDDATPRGVLLRARRAEIHKGGSAGRR